MVGKLEEKDKKVLRGSAESRKNYAKDNVGGGENSLGRGVEKVAKGGSATKKASETSPSEKGRSNTQSFEEIGRVDKREYEKLKRRAIRFEKKNDQFILVIPCDGDKGWCEVAERSALLYKYQVCMKNGSPVTMTDDLDSFYIQYEIGRIRTRGFDTIRRRLKAVGLYKDERLEDRAVIFQLMRRFSDKDFEAMLSEEKEHQSAVNNIVKVTFSDPTMHQKMMEVATRLHRICNRRLDRLSSATNGRRMVELADGMIRRYYEIAGSEKRKSPEELILGWQNIRECTRALLIELQIVAGLKLWTHEACVNIGESVAFLDERVARHIKHEMLQLERQREQIKENERMNAAKKASANEAKGNAGVSTDKDKVTNKVGKTRNDTSTVKAVARG